MKSVKDEGIVTQLAVVATMMPKVKKYIDQQADRIAELEQNLSAYIVELELHKAMIQDLERKLNNV